jgi:hypothetical protein
MNGETLTICIARTRRPGSFGCDPPSAMVQILAESPDRRRRGFRGWPSKGVPHHAETPEPARVMCLAQYARTWSQFHHQCRSRSVQQKTVCRKLWVRGIRRGHRFMVPSINDAHEAVLQQSCGPVSLRTSATKATGISDDLDNVMICPQDWKTSCSSKLRRSGTLRLC